MGNFVKKICAALLFYTGAERYLLLPTQGTSSFNYFILYMQDSKSNDRPRILHTLTDLERMRTNVLAGNEPWTANYNAMTADPRSSANLCHGRAIHVLHP
jgi:hypothetical protein